MRPLHILFHFGNRNVKVQTKRENDASHKDDENCKSGIFKIGDLDFHGSEFDAPANVASWRRWFEAHVLPVCGLEVFKVVGINEVVLVYGFVEDDEGGADEEVGYVVC